MAARVIADSDGDESEAESASHVSRHDAEEQTRASSHDVDHHPSASTDPNFFNSVFTEQQDAARQQSGNHGAIDLTGESDAMDYASFDQGFERVGNTAAHVEKSPWDVPSSPESAKPKRSTKKNTENSTSTKITRGLRRQLDDIGYISPDDEPTTAQNLNKKRCIRSEMDVADASVSALSIESDECFLVAPTALASSSSPAQPLNHCSINVKSSGTATNINTPREGYPPSAKPSSPERPKSSTPEKPDETQGGVRSTSVAIRLDDDYAPEKEEQDDGSYQENPEAKPTSTKKPRGRPKKVVDASSTKETNVAAVQVKKKRGRPKKSDKVFMDDDNKPKYEDPASTHTDPVPEGAGTQQQVNQDSATLAISQAPEATGTNKQDILQLPETPTRQAENADSSVNNATPNKKDSLAQNSASRQLYRVGLSKKTKIAPLLKMIRK